MSEMTILNPYAVAPAQGVSMAETNRHSGGNALASNEEARAVSEVKAQVLMAKQFPRDPQAAVENILTECKRPTLAETAVYIFPRGKETVTGPSIRLAEVMARNWGNCSFGYRVLERRKDEDGVGLSVINAYAWDLQTNMMVNRNFEVRHWRSTRSGGYPITDDRDIYELEANMASRRLRACILQMIPGDVTAVAVNACRATSSSGLADKMKNTAEREKIVKGTVNLYEKMGVSLADLEDYLHCKSADWTADQMLKLKELKNGLSDGVISMADVFPHLAGNEKNATITKEQITQLMEAAKSTGRQGDISDAMKKMGISKFADVPAAKFDEVMQMIQSFENIEQLPPESEPAQPAVE